MEFSRGSRFHRKSWRPSAGPTYRWVFEKCPTAELEQLKGEMARHDIVLLDYETNADVADLSKPLSHARLTACSLENQWRR